MKVNFWRAAANPRSEIGDLKREIAPRLLTLAMRIVVELGEGIDDHDQRSIVPVRRIFFCSNKMP